MQILRIFCVNAPLLSHLGDYFTDLRPCAKETIYLMFIREYIRIFWKMFILAAEIKRL